MDCCAHEGPDGGDARFDIQQVADGVHVAVAAPLVAAAALKITYDVALWISFRRLRPPEERPTPGSPGWSARSSSFL